MNKYLVTLRINGQLIKSVVWANSVTHARLLCQYQFGMGCVHVVPTQIQSEGHDHPLLDDLKPPKPKQMRVTPLKANVDRQKEALKQERERQKRQREVGQARRGAIEQDHFAGLKGTG